MNLNVRGKGNQVRILSILGINNTEEVKIVVWGNTLSGVFTIK